VHFIYLHGFCSSAESFKAQLVKQHVENQSGHSLFLIDLPHSPAQAMAMVESHIAELAEQDWGVIGSSLGGFYTTYLCEKYAKRGVLINPAVRAHQLLEAMLGENKNYHTAETFTLTREHLEQLRALYLPRLKKSGNLLLLTQTADEVLDYQQGVDYYQGSEQLVIEGGSHGFDDYENYLDKTFNFLMGQNDD
tara:strand:- start:110224 stop:110802 length:579 start_codon:yes stop_codon:yes gene_type:complete